LDLDIASSVADSASCMKRNEKETIGQNNLTKVGLRNKGK